MNNSMNDLEKNRRNVNLQEPSFDTYIQIILRGKWVILAVFGLVFAATALYTFTERPVYESTATVLVDTKGQQSSLAMFDMLGAGGLKNIKNELEILKSGSLAESVAQLLLERKFLDALATEGIEIIKGPEDSAKSRPYATVREIAERLKLVVFEPVRESDVIKITARSRDAREAALLANTYAEAYYNRNLLASRTRSRAVSEFLDHELKNRRQTLASAEDTLQQYMQAKGIVSLDDESKKVIEQLSLLEATRDADGINIESLSKSLSSYEEELKKVEPNVSKVMGDANDPYIRLLQEQLAKLEVQRDVTVAQNPAIAGQAIYNDKLKEIDGQISALRAKLQNRTGDYLKTLIPGQTASSSASDPSLYLSQLMLKIVDLRIQRQALVAKKKALDEVVKQYESQFNLIPAKSIKYARLQRNRLSNEKLYLLVEEKFNESAIKEKSEFGYIDIIDPAVVPSERVSPRVRLNLLLGAILGLGLGIGFVFLREFIDVRVRTLEDLKKRGYSALTAVGLMDSEIAKLDQSDPPVEAHLLSLLNPLSSAAESYRRLRTSIQYAQLDVPASTIVVTSSNPGEGKTTTICNLAIIYAHDGKRTVLLDTDFRKPNLHNEFKVERMPGLTDFLLGNALLSDVIRKTPIDNLDLICCGTVPPNPSETLGSRKMKDFLIELKKQYDIVLMDSPPVLAVTDPAVLATLSDGVVLVVSSGTTRVVELEQSCEAIGAVRASVLGVVLNNFDLRMAYGGDYKYYRYKYYSYGYGYSYGDDGAGNERKRKKKIKSEK